MSDICLGDLPECLRAFAVELELHGPSVVAVVSVRFGHTVASKVGLFLNQQALDDRFLTFVLLDFVGLDPVLRRNDFGTGVDRAQARAVIRIHQPKLELRDPRELLARFNDLRRIQPGDLHKDAICADRADHGLAATEVIDALADDLDSLVEIILGERPIALHQPDEEGSAALNIQTELNLLAGWPDSHDAEDDQQHHE